MNMYNSVDAVDYKNVPYKFIIKEKEREFVFHDDVI
jgi:hypothetical protein